MTGYSRPRVLGKVNRANARLSALGRKEQRHAHDEIVGTHSTRTSGRACRRYRRAHESCDFGRFSSATAFVCRTRCKVATSCSRRHRRQDRASRNPTTVDLEIKQVRSRGAASGSAAVDRRVYHSDRFEALRRSTTCSDTRSEHSCRYQSYAWPRAFHIAALCLTAPTPTRCGFPYVRALLGRDFLMGQLSSSAQRSVRTSLRG